MILSWLSSSVKVSLSVLFYRQMPRLSNLRVARSALYCRRTRSDVACVCSPPPSVYLFISPCQWSFLRLSCIFYWYFSCIFLCMNDMKQCFFALSFFFEPFSSVTEKQVFFSFTFPFFFISLFSSLCLDGKDLDFVLLLFCFSACFACLSLCE